MICEIEILPNTMSADVTDYLTGEQKWSLYTNMLYLHYDREGILPFEKFEQTCQ